MLYAAGTEVLGDNGGCAQHDTYKEQVDRQPDIVADGDGGKVGVVVAPGHDGIDNAGAHLGQLGDNHRPGNRQESAAFAQID